MAGPETGCCPSRAMGIFNKRWGGDCDVSGSGYVSVFRFLALAVMEELPITKNMIKTVYLAKPRGFCAGVNRAVASVEAALKHFGSPLYVRHQIVHNHHVVADFEKRGVVFVEELVQVPSGCRVIISAHGAGPKVYKEALKRQLHVIDATCPLVTKVHTEVKQAVQNGYFVLYIGHRGHPETEGVLGEVPTDMITLLETKDDAKQVAPLQTEKLIVLSQTTLSFDDTQEIMTVLENRFPNLTKPSAADICYATQNRQKAVKALTEKTPVILVIGSKESSNSNRLKDVASAAGAYAYLIDDISELHPQWLESTSSVGITAGASVPEYVITQAVNYFTNQGAAVEEINTVTEAAITFTLPKELYESA